MNNFTFCSPTKFVFGRGVTDTVGAELAEAGYRRALIVYGQGSVVRTGTLDRVKASLDAAGVSHVELGGVRPNPEIALVREGAALAEREQVDIVLPVGGGSAMDCAKGIAIATGYTGDAWDFWSKKATVEHCLPIATVVTIPPPAQASTPASSAMTPRAQAAQQRPIAPRLPSWSNSPFPSCRIRRRRGDR
ncbi:MAG: iron-containing alcohol dehydrogenase [Collinsella intestinalis]